MFMGNLCSDFKASCSHVAQLFSMNLPSGHVLALLELEPRTVGRWRGPLLRVSLLLGVFFCPPRLSGAMGFFLVVGRRVNHGPRGSGEHAHYTELGSSECRKGAQP